QLSGGQQQRMFIARALAQEAELMLMDEPLTGLDAGSQEDVFNVLDQLQTEDVTVVVSLHDLKMASQRFGRVLLLHKAMVGIGPPDEVLTSDNLLSAYGGHFQLEPTDEGAQA
ncbi:MAG: ATP-binding cassette domain-containing protein, partial [Chloroflexi bacterium]|nr:ATP-binding cassette domain-containing protein [Chloroflexota bacterium]